MTSNYAYTPLFLPSISTVLFLLVLSIFSWRRRSLPGAIPLMISCLFGAAYAAGSVLEYATVDLATKIFWSKVQSCVQAPGVVAITCFILEYAWPKRWLTRRMVILQAIVSLAYLGLALTNDFHHLAWTGFQWNGSGPIQQQLGLASWFAIFTILPTTGLISLIVFIWLFLRSPQHRWPAVLMLAGQLVGRTLYILVKAEVMHFVLPLDLLGMGFEFFTYAIALFGFRILDPIPMARQTAFAQLRDGLLVLDPQERVTGMNPAAQNMLGAPLEQIKGKPVREVLPVYADDYLDGAHADGIEFSLKTGQEERCYQLRISSLKDWRGLEAGKMLMMLDVTQQKQAQAQIVNQQRALATLQERELLARELHDSLGQTLAAARLQTSAARRLLAQGETIEAEDCLEQVIGMTTAAEMDVREYLLGAKIFFPANLPFFQALRQYVQRFSQQCGLPVELSIPEKLEAQGLGQGIEVQALRIIQEALSNIRKHARAHSAALTFSLSDEGRMRISISDDGQGFDPETTRQAEGFGLQSMRERAEALEGCFSVTSLPGQGTQVLVSFPHANDVEVQEHGRLLKRRTHHD